MRYEAFMQISKEGIHGHRHGMYTSCPALHCTLSDALIRPILSYCCQVCPWVILNGEIAMLQLEQVYIHFLRQLLGVPATIPTKVVHAEFGNLSLRYSWLQQCLSSLARLQQMAESRLRWSSKQICSLG